MKVSEKWLREWVELDATTEEIEHQLIMPGTELDGADPIASAFTNVVVGQIKSIEAHPDADRLRVCQVDVAADEFIQIVTNAMVDVDQKVPVAMIGAQLPESDGKIFKIKKSKLRGVLSQGMFCGSETLGMDDTGEGLLAIPADAHRTGCRSDPGLHERRDRLVEHAHSLLSRGFGKRRIVDRPCWLGYRDEASHRLADEKWSQEKVVLHCDMILRGGTSAFRLKTHEVDLVGLAVVDVTDQALGGAAAR